MNEKIAMGDEAWMQFEAGTMSETELDAYLELLFGPATQEAPLTAEESQVARMLAKK